MVRAPAYSSLTIRRSVSLDPMRTQPLYSARGANSPRDVREFRQHRSSPPSSHTPRSRYMSFESPATRPDDAIEDEELELQMRVAMALSLAEHRKHERSGWQQFEVDPTGQLPHAQPGQLLSDQLDALTLDRNDNHPRDKFAHSPTPTPSLSVSNDLFGSGDLSWNEQPTTDPWAPLSDPVAENRVSPLTPRSTADGGTLTQSDSNQPTRTVFDELALVDFTQTQRETDRVPTTGGTVSPGTTFVESRPQNTNPFVNGTPLANGDSNVSVYAERSMESGPVANFLGEYSSLVDLENLMHPQFHNYGGILVGSNDQIVPKQINYFKFTLLHNTQTITRLVHSSGAPHFNYSRGLMHGASVATFGPLTKDMQLESPSPSWTTGYPPPPAATGVLQTPVDSFGLLHNPRRLFPQAVSNNPFL
ncbi:unnamed protein product [Echinostoma caproni]|uniref:PUM-HD domain-containing protein n=1 Tax=Echinostoma caproni TaxID=27848 RepID=A0A183AEE0_9TREM|nr:unnamed protein product [Echinostoma caproni]